ncbi:MAG: Holliday junction resolvase Hjc [Candidatus Woesearchaeota archaeon]
MNKKNKGTTAERELIHKFWSVGWAAFRAAGSGSARHPCPDIIAGNSLRKIAIETKSINSERKYFTRKEIDDLRGFSYIFGSEAWIGIKFQSKGWHFFSIEDLKETPLGFSICFKDAELKGFSFDELIKTKY